MEKKADTKNELISKIVNRAGELNSRLDAGNGRRAEYLALFLIIVIHCVVSIFHEPCFDESHAWSIAKDGTIYQLLFEVPHYEGHPALWHLIMVPFAKCGVSIKATFFIITSVFCVLNSWLILFKTPFCRGLRLVLPFTYFFIYQYGVVARPYCMLVTAILLAAALREDRDLKPARYVTVLIFLCATSAFGVAISAGIAIEWVIEIITPLFRRNVKIKSLVKDKRVYLLLILLIYAVTLLLRAVPENKGASISFNADGTNGTVLQLVYLLFGLASDGFITNSYTNGYLKDYEFMMSELVCVCIIGALLLGVICYAAKRYGTVKAFILPYLCFVVFSKAVYFCVYNSGIAVLIIVYWGIVTVNKNGIKKETETIDTKSDENILDEVLNEGKERTERKNEAGTNSRNKIIYTFREKLSMAGTVLFIIPLIWGIMSCTMDIFLNYAFGEKEGEFLSQSEYATYNICFDWTGNSSGENAKTVYDYGQKHIMKNIQLRPFVDQDRILNWPLDYSIEMFYQASETSEEHETICENLMAHSMPDILIGEVPIEQLAGNGEKGNIFTDYHKIYISHVDKIWKGNLSSAQTYIYIRNDLVK